MKVFELHNQPVEADTYEASMALNQLLKIGKHAIKIHNMIDDSAEMEAWVAKKIDLAGDYVKKVHGYMQGEKAGLYDDGGMTEGTNTPATDKEIKMAKGIAFDKRNKDNMSKATSTIEKVKKGLSQQPDVADALKTANEDAGEGHMSKSTLYHTAKYAIELMDMINKGDDLEGWVQSKLNKAADYLQGVHNYEEYQKLNPYREELDATILQKHAGIVQKNIDEILARETSLDDVDTKPGMMRILAKRVNEVEKEIAKEQRKEQVSERMPASIIKHKEKLAYMSDKELAQHFKDKDDETLKQMAWRHGYGKMSPHYVNRRNRGMNEGIMTESPRAVGRALANLKYAKAMAKDVMDDVDPALTKSRAQAFLGSVDETIGLLDKMYNPVKEQSGLEEGLKDWAKNLAAAGVIVGAVAGLGSINNAIDNSVPAVKAMNTAYEMAVDAGNDDLAKMIKQDISDAKVRLSSGKDLDHMKHLQDKYSKFMQTEGLTYESKLAVMLNQQLK